MRTSYSRADALARARYRLVAVERGGDVTYHGPGQLVVYPIRRLERFREVVPLVRSLEGAVIDGLRAVRRQRRSLERARRRLGRAIIKSARSAWRCERMVSMHGLALQRLQRDLDYDRLINPCGLSDRGITSLSARRGAPSRSMRRSACCSTSLSRVFDVSFIAEKLVA